MTSACWSHGSSIIARAGRAALRPGRVRQLRRRSPVSTAATDELDLRQLRPPRAHARARLSADADDEIEPATAPIPSPTAPRTCPTCCARSSASTPIPTASSSAGRAASSSRRAAPACIDLLADMTQAIRSEFTYGTRLLGGPQTPLETLELGSGSCRDFAVLMIEAVRSLGLAARFVSGYIYSPARGRGDARRARRRPHPRLGAGLSAGLRLGGVRPHQRHRRQRRPDPRRRRPRPAPGPAAVRLLRRRGCRLSRHGRQRRWSTSSSDRGATAGASPLAS